MSLQQSSIAHVSPDSLRHVSALDGVRAVAILLVMAFHIAPQYIPGGAVGVDVFFALSAFLITSLLWREVEAHGSISLRSFYWRRLVRLAPALVLFLVLVAPAVAIARGDADVIVGGTINSGLYLSDFARADLLGSLPPLTDPYGHTWSLAVEEQFYLLWPLVLVGIHRFRRSAIVPILVCLLLLSIAIFAASWLSLGGPRTYFLPTGHGPALMAGALAAVLRPTDWSSSASRGYLLSVFGAAALAIAALVNLNERGLVTTLGVYAIGAMGSALLILLAASPTRTLLTWVLSTAPMIWIGQRSYGIYLYHTALLYLLGTKHFQLSYATGHALMVVVSFAIADVSFRFVERPIRSWGRRVGPVAHPPAKPSGQEVSQPTP